VVPQEDAPRRLGGPSEPTDGGTDTSLQISVQCYGTKAARRPIHPSTSSSTRRVAAAGGGRSVFTVGDLPG